MLQSRWNIVRNKPSQCHSLLSFIRQLFTSFLFVPCNFLYDSIYAGGNNLIMTNFGAFDVRENNFLTFYARGRKSIGVEMTEL